MTTPRARAIFWFTASSNSAGASIGRSPGAAPWNTRATRWAMRLRSDGRVRTITLGEDAFRALQTRADVTKCAPIDAEIQYRVPVHFRAASGTTKAVWIAVTRLGRDMRKLEKGGTLARKG